MAEEPLCELVFSSQQSVGEDIQKALFQCICWQKLTGKMKEEHRKAIKEKEAALFLLNDELTEVDCRIQMLEFDNVALQAQRRCIRESAAEVSR